jgi:hypothetical protein
MAMTQPHSPCIDLAGAQRQRVEAVMACGFTERQARFLVLVMRHAGVCVPRQYAMLGGIANGGRRCNAFFDRLLRRGFAREIPCGHNRARLYHVHHKPLYFVMGGTSSRYRRTVSARLVVERLMLLDAVLGMPDVEWLTTAAEKATLLARLTAETSAATAPAASVARTSDALPRLSSGLPIGVESDNRVVLLFLAAEPDIEGFRTFVQAQAHLLRPAQRWTLRIAFPRPLDRNLSAYQGVVNDEFTSPLQAPTVSELKWYFEHRRVAMRDEVHPTTRQTLDVAANAFGAPRFTAMYQRWLRHGNAVFEGPSSPAIAEALASGRGGVESIVLPHVYRHLSPLVANTPTRPVSMDEGLRRGNKEGEQVSARPQRAPSTPPEEALLSMREQQERDWRRLVEAHNAQRAQGFRP